tara:strand:- start:11363 stop:12001 length:639 start_codon:yes stop_codon:yes gene_type:complete
MITLYSWTTPNGRKISIALEEMGLPYESIAIDITKEEQFAPEFLKISPSNKIPVILDEGRAVFESGAILLYMAHKTGKFMPALGSPEYFEMMQWLMWQMSGFGPTAGQAHHFLHYNPGVSEYSEKRYHDQVLQLYRVLDTQLANREFIVNSLSIVDFATWPWVARFGYHRVCLHQFPNVKRWYVQLAERPGFQRGYAQPMDAGLIPYPNENE